MSIEFKLGTMDIAEIAAACGGKLCKYGMPANAAVSGITTDSRDAGKGDLFVAIKGEKFDGHDCIAQAVSSGAVCVVGERMPKAAVSGYCLILVDDSIKAVGKIAKHYKERANIKTIAITGSVGKTTTKETVAAVLSEKFKVHKTRANHNNELGLPLSLFEIEPDERVSVLEMGMSGFGEISYLSKIASPDIAIITNIGSSHMEQLGSRENICRAKYEITEGLAEGGKLILSGDEPLLTAHRGDKFAPLFISAKGNQADCSADNITYTEDSTSFDANIFGEKITNITIPALGLHHVYSALFASAAGKLLGLTGDEIREGCGKFENTGMRQSIYDIGGVTVIDASYNASPESMRASLDVLCELARRRGARKFALLGDMRELGTESRRLHEEVGEYAATLGLDGLFTYGVAADSIATAAKHGGMKENVSSNMDISNPSASGSAVVSVLKPGDILLVKASRAVAAEKIIEYLKEHIG